MSLIRTLTATVAAACWAVLVLAWVAGALVNTRRGSGRPPRRRPGPAGFAAASVVVAVTVTAVVGAVPAWAWQGATVRTAWAEVPGSAVLVASTAFALWARVALGRMWSLAPMIRDGHTLRTHGPYAVTRHPIYTGLLGMLTGTVFIVGFGRSLVVIPAAATVLAIKNRAEEQLLLESFPDEYPPYRRRVPRLVPGLRLLRRRPRTAGA